jgi:hypothetical protein
MRDKISSGTLSAMEYLFGEGYEGQHSVERKVSTHSVNGELSFVSFL